MSARGIVASMVMLALTACAVDQAAIDAETERITPRIERDCRVAVIVGDAADMASVAVPGVGIIDHAIDAACADPAATARAISAAREAARTLRDQR
jgi:hypothetical protein